ncbi:MAG: hypothetical protein WA175_07105, partial [Candidatus Acidiferrales bacterium]
MKKLILGLVMMLFIAGAASLPAVAGAQSQPGQPAVPGRPLKLVLARQSMVSPVDLMKDISEKCPNVTLT